VYWIQCNCLRTQRSILAGGFSESFYTEPKRVTSRQKCCPLISAISASLSLSVDQGFRVSLLSWRLALFISTSQSLHTPICDNQFMRCRQRKAQLLEGWANQTTFKEKILWMESCSTLTSLVHEIHISSFSRHKKRRHHASRRTWKVPWWKLFLGRINFTVIAPTPSARIRRMPDSRIGRRHRLLPNSGGYH